MEVVNAPLTIAVYISAIISHRAEQRSEMAVATARKRGGSRLFGAAMLAAGASLLVIGTGSAISQQSNGLRGAISQAEIERQLLPRWLSAQDATAPEPNTGQTTSSAPGREARSSALFAGQDDIFVDPLEPRTTTTLARERRSARAIGANVEASAGSVSARLPEDDITTGTVRTQPLEGWERDELRRTAPEAAREGAIEGLGRPADPSPFAPVGLRLGTFEVFPSLEQGIGWTSNATNTQGGESASFSETTLRLDARSDWGRHSASLAGTGTYRKSVAGAPIQEIEGNVDGQLRLDLPNDFSARAGFGYDTRPESAFTPGAIAGVAERPNRHVLTGTAGLSKDAGLARLTATAGVNRTLYDDARLSDGTTVSQRERNSTLATFTLRGGYAISPALRPFAEGEIGRRFQDVRIDAAGYQRSANRYALRGGLELDMGEKLSGELAAGWLMERPDDAALQAISGLSLQGNLNWSPVRGTTVSLNGSTTVEGSTTPGDSGSFLYSTNLSLSRDLRANLTGTALLGADYRRYPGSAQYDLTLRGEASLTWWLNRYAGLVGRVRHEQFRSNQPGRESQQTSIYMGIRAQR
jgi:hypothetical protein